MTRHPVRHFSAFPEGAELAVRLLSYLNGRNMRARVNEAGEVALVWEIADLDQLDAFLRELSLPAAPGEIAQ
jgi:hypothetical protein